MSRLICFVLLIFVASTTNARSQRVLFQRSGGYSDDGCFRIYGRCGFADGIGDMDGDGVDDFAILHARRCNPWDVVCSYGLPCPPLSTLGWGLISGATLQTIARLGPPIVRIVGLGDVDGDGFDDIAAQLTDPPNVEIRGGPTGVVLNTIVIPGRPERAGDVDGDGLCDLVIWNAGAVHILRHDGTIIRQLAPPAGLQFTAATAAGDVNADGRADIIAGARLAPGGMGEVNVYSGLDGSVLHTLRGSPTALDFGAIVSGLGDVDGDGFDDVCGSNGAEVLAFSGRTGATILAAQGLGGSVLLPFGDVDGDQTADFLLTDPRYGYRAQVISGATSQVLYTRDWAHILRAGDVNADGIEDFLEYEADLYALGSHFVGSARVLTFAPPSPTDVAREWTHGVGCRGADGRLRRIDYRGNAQLGGSIDVRLLAGRSNVAAVLHIGDPTSVDLALFGAPGCTLLSAPFVAIRANVDSLGFASIDLPLPVGVAPIGHRLELQWAVWDAGSNPLGVTVSDALALRIGA